MPAQRMHAVSILLSICALLTTGHTQTSNVQTAAEAINSQDTNPKSSKSADALPGSTDNTNQAAPVQKIERISPAQRATPANPAATDQNLPLPATTAPSLAEVPQMTLFELFFNNMSVLNEVADKNDKAGDHITATAWRTHDQRSAELNDAEGQILREITLDCVRLLKENDAKIRTLAERDRARMPSGVTSPASAEMIQAFEDRKQVLSNHIEKLREALGEASFNKLDNYVHSSFHANVVAPKPASPSTTIVEKHQQENK